MYAYAVENRRRRWFTGAEHTKIERMKNLSTARSLKRRCIMGWLTATLYRQDIRTCNCIRY